VATILAVAVIQNKKPTNVIIIIIIIIGNSEV